MINKALSFWLALATWMTADISRAAVKVEQLRCDRLENPLGIDTAHPKLSWKIISEERGQKQTAYQVLVASSAKLLAKGDADLWDSGNVSSDQSVQVSYGGKELGTFERCHWKVRLWDRDGKASAWSAPAEWTMGILPPEDWQAKWIGAPDTNFPSLRLRREFAVKRGLKRALVSVCGLGQYELSLNGRKSGKDLLSPGWTKYDKTCLYDTHDVTRMLKPGANAVGLVLGSGMYRVTGGRYAKFKGSFGPLKAIAQVRLEYADGSVQTLGSDASWRVSPGPITFSCIYGGEDFDARKVEPGWDRAGFDSMNWTAAVEMSGPGGVLRGQSAAAPPLRIIETIQPINRRPLKAGVEVYDLGQNAPIMPRIQVKGPAGSIVRLTPAELINADGTVDRNSAGQGKSYWQYTLAGQGKESWLPKFHYQGCRYLQVECRPAETGGELPVVQSLAGEVIHTASEPVGEFQCSNGLFNRIHTLIRWAQRANLVSVITDCPHRERLGWLEQYHLNGPSLRYEFNLDRLFAKVMDDMRDSQLPTGMVPSIAPEYTVFGKTPEDESNGFRNSPEWGSAMVLVPWQQYEFTGDTGLMRRHYDEMKRYAAYLESRAKNDILNFGLGDWYDLGPKHPGSAQLTPKELTATAFYYLDTRVLAQAAESLGKTDDAKMFAAQADRIRSSFNGKFYNPATGGYSTGSQCANAIPLAMGLVEETNRAAVLQALVTDVESRGNGLTAGDVGYRYLLRALAEGGRSDLIYAMNNQSDKPGYGYQLAQGATSLTEAWDAQRTSSQNHFMLGHIIEWFYHDLAGIQCDPAGPGFQRIIIKPQIVGDLTWAKGSYDSVRGKISSAWERHGDQFNLRLVIPVNTTATVYLPAATMDSIRESGRNLGRVSGVQSVRWENGHAVLKVASGRYEFKSPLK